MDYPQSEQGEKTPPPITMLALHDNPQLSPLPSPFRFPRTAMNTPQTNTYNPLDVDVNMPPGRNTPVSPATPTQAIRVTVPMRAQPIPQANNQLGLTTQPEGLPSLLTTTTVLARLEEEAIDSPTSRKNPAHNPLDKYSPGPMPSIQDSSPTAIFDFIDLKLIKEWEDCQGGKLIAIPFDNDVRNVDSHEFLRNRIFTATAEIINAQEISVVALKPSEVAVKANRYPTSFLIYNITSEQVEFLLQRKVWSSKAITFHVTPFATTCPSYSHSETTIP
jgi:hypothetical protein